MKIKFSSRKWHAWISFVLSLPILLVAITSILIAHAQTLGFRDIKIEANWLPGYAGAAAPLERDERPAASTNDARKPLTLARLIRDLHTGEALFGRNNKWIWDDIVGGAMTFLALTGVYLWWKGQRKLFVAKRVREKTVAVNSLG